MGKLYWGATAVLALALLGTLYKFVVQGSTVQGTDGRAAIQLTAGERDLVLLEMRTFLTSLQQITQGLSAKDMKLVAESAKKVGAAAQRSVPASLIGKLPLAFKTLGFDTHGKFDALALDAEQLGDPAHTLSQVSALMQNCVACHATYRMDAPSP